MDLNELRQDIDKIDEELVKLFVKRMELSKAVADYKAKQGLAVLNQAREDEVLDKISTVAGEKFANQARELYNKLFAISRSYQEDVLKRK